MLPKLRICTSTCRYIDVAYVIDIDVTDIDVMDIDVIVIDVIYIDVIDIDVIDIDVSPLSSMHVHLHVRELKRGGRHMHHGDKKSKEGGGERRPDKGRKYVEAGEKEYKGGRCAGQERDH